MSNASPTVFSPARALTLLIVLGAFVWIESQVVSLRHENAGLRADVEESHRRIDEIVKAIR